LAKRAKLDLASWVDRGHSIVPPVKQKKEPVLKKGGKMEIRIEKNLVEFEPESDGETAMIEDLWKLMVDCAKFNKKLVPVGEYLPQKRNLARFAIEG
jgi:hypothetical protein